MNKKVNKTKVSFFKKSERVKKIVEYFSKYQITPQDIIDEYNRLKSIEYREREKQNGIPTVMPKVQLPILF